MFISGYYLTSALSVQITTTTPDVTHGVCHVTTFLVTTPAMKMEAKFA